MPYIGKSPSAGVRQRYQYTATAGQTTFSGTDLGNLTLTYTDNNFVDVFQNGVLLKGGGTDYTATSGTSVVLATGASVSDVIEIIVYDVFSVGNFFNRTDSDSRYVNVSGGTMTGSLDLNGTELVLDADGDTSITADTDDQVDIKVSGSDKVTITTTGLGVGTTAPPVPLTSSISSNGGNVLAYRSSESDGDYGGVEFHNHPSSLTGYRKGAIYFQSDGNGFGRGAMSFCVDGDGDANNVGIADERMRIDSSGRILIAKNTTSTSTDGLEIRTTGSDAGRINHASPSELFYFYDSSDGGQVGYIAHNGSNVTYSTSSDYRLKENIVTDWDATTRWKQLKPTRFSWKKESKTQADTDGFLAHEVSSIVPQAIKGEKDAVDADGNPEYQGIDHSTLVPLLTKALQESIARADALEARIKKLEDG